MPVVNGVIDIVLLLVILVLLVVVHELGHFVAARRAGVRVHEFGIGFPPRARVLGRGADTTYTLNWLPIGGFVRLEGEEGDSDDPRAFVNQPLPTRLLILAAGVAMNFVLAVLIFTSIALLADPVYDARIAFVQPGSPAESVGLQGGRQVGADADGNPIFDDSGDVIVAIDGRTFPVFDNVGRMVPPQSVYLGEHAGQGVVLTVRQGDGTVADVPVTLRVPSGSEQGSLGVGFNGFPLHDTQQGPLDALASGARRTIDASTLILRGLRDLITDLANPQVSGPVGIVGAVGAFRAQLPPVFLLWLVGVLSANLAVINALPFPPMDGGRFAVSIIQALSGNRISPALERAVYLTGFVLLMLLLVWITLFDTGIFQRQIGT